MRVLKKSVKFTALLTAMVMTVPVMTQSAYGQHAKQNYNVDLNKTNIIRLPRAASAVLIGNPDIADISVHSAKTLFIVGRGYGETNLIVLDRNGHEVLDTNITVTNNLSSHNVRLYKLSSNEHEHHPTQLNDGYKHPAARAPSDSQHNSTMVTNILLRELLATAMQQQQNMTTHQVLTGRI